MAQQPTNNRPQQNRHRSLRIIAGGLLLITIGFVAGYYTRWFVYTSTATVTTYDNPPLRENDPNYPLISRLYTGGTLSDARHVEYTPLTKQVDAIIANAKKIKTATDVSLYFQDFNLGRTASINENALYFPASLSKVPILIAYLKLAQQDPKLLTKTFLYDGSFDDDVRQNIPPEHQLIAGTTYTADELLKSMIAYSDNNATHLLYLAMDPAQVSKIFSDLHVPMPSVDAALDSTAITSYSYFFRVLYNATYLNRAMSEKALQLMSESEFADGIRAGTPQSVTIAEKFGESIMANTSPEISELHDCGVIYVPDHHYLLCVMTKGSSLDSLRTVIRDISKTVYETVTAKAYEPSL